MPRPTAIKTCSRIPQESSLFKTPDRPSLMPVSLHLLALRHGQMVWLVVSAFRQEADEAEAPNPRNRLGVLGGWRRNRSWPGSRDPLFAAGFPPQVSQHFRDRYNRVPYVALAMGSRGFARIRAMICCRMRAQNASSGSGIGSFLMAARRRPRRL